MRRRVGASSSRGVGDSREVLRERGRLRRLQEHLEAREGELERAWRVLAPVLRGDLRVARGGGGDGALAEDGRRARGTQRGERDGVDADVRRAADVGTRPLPGLQARERGRGERGGVRGGGAGLGGGGPALIFVLLRRGLGRRSARRARRGRGGGRRFGLPRGVAAVGASLGREGRAGGAARGGVGALALRRRGALEPLGDLRLALRAAALAAGAGGGVAAGTASALIEAGGADGRSRIRAGPEGRTRVRATRKRRGGRARATRTGAGDPRGGSEGARRGASRRARVWRRRRADDEAWDATKRVLAASGVSKSAT